MKVLKGWMVAARGRVGAVLGLFAVMALVTVASPAHATAPTFPTIAWGTASQSFLTEVGTVFGAVLPYGVLILALFAGWKIIRRMIHA